MQFIWFFKWKTFESLFFLIKTYSDEKASAQRISPDKHTFIIAFRLLNDILPSKILSSGHSGRGAFMAVKKNRYLLQNGEVQALCYMV